MLEFIGQIRTPYAALEDCPSNIDPKGPLCELVIRKGLESGLSGLHPEHKILVLYWLGGADRATLVQTSRKDGERRGVFALRSPHRPNPIGAGEVTIERIEQQRVFVRGLDCLDGTPLLDIKPAIVRPL